MYACMYVKEFLPAVLDAIYKCIFSSKLSPVTDAAKTIFNKKKFPASLFHRGRGCAGLPECTVG